MRHLLIVLALLGLLVFALSRHGIQITEKEDVLTRPNLLSYINKVRVQKGLSLFTESQPLTQEAEKEAVNLINGRKAAVPIAESFTVLDDDHYSVKKLADSWLSQPEKRKILLSEKTQIGVAVVYVVISNEKPVPYVVVMTP